MSVAAVVAHSRDKQPLRRDLIAIGASAGGVEALQKLVRTLPEDLPAAVLVVLHVLAGGRSLLGDILGRAGRLPAAAATDGAHVELGRIYVAPPDYHLLLRGQTLRLVRGPRENGHRPAIDLLFRSAAESRGRQTIGVVLSGLLDDGASGVRAIKASGGAAIVQAPRDALFPAMPRAAIEATEVDAVLPISQMAEMLAMLLAEDIYAAPSDVSSLPGPAARRSVGAARGATAGVGAKGGDANPSPGVLAGFTHAETAPTIAALLEGSPTGLTCPDCGGALWEWRDGNLQRFSCNVGHSFTVESMLNEQGRSLESALWGALRALEERADLLRRLSRDSSGITRRNFDQRSRQVDAHARQLRDTLMAAGSEPAVGLDAAAGSSS
jgi:two-component system chemotaxis response regulator CheB